MRKNLVSKVLRASAFASACLALAGPNASAASVTSVPSAGTETYSASGSVGTAGISSPSGTASNVISYSFGNSSAGTPSLSYNGTTAITLGQFQVATLAAGQETDYKNTPFTLTYNPVSYSNGTSNMAYAGSTTPIMISGVLNGAVTGSTSTVVATFNAIQPPTFTSPDGSVMNTISIPNNPLNLVAPSAGGSTTVQAQVIATAPSSSGAGGVNPTPEPTTLAILGTAVVGLGLRKRLRKARLAD